MSSVPEPQIKKSLLMRWLDHFEESFIAFLIGASTIVIFVAVVHRYLSGFPIPVLQDFLISINMSWAQELCIYMFVWMAKFGAAYGVRVGIHVGVDILVNKLPEHLSKKLTVVAFLGGIIFTGFVGILGSHFVWHIGMRYAIAKFFGLNWPDLTEGPTSPDLEAPMWIVYSAIPLGSFLMTFRFIQGLILFLKTGYIPHHEVGHVDGLEEKEDEVIAQKLQTVKQGGN